MKFLCDRCKTRYSIGDDRVRGKILKIRCKNCANVITVREGMTADEPGASGRQKKVTTASPPVIDSAPANGRNALSSAFADAMAKPAPAALEEEWYVSIDGDQSGPYSLAEAQRWVGQKPFEAELYCWSEGFDDWLPVDKVSHFRGLRKKPPAPAAPPPLPRLAPAARATAAAAAPRVEREEEPKPLFAATMASLEKSVQPSNPAISIPSIAQPFSAPASARATPPGGTPIQAKSNGSSALAKGSATSGAVRNATRPGVSAPAANPFDASDAGDSATTIEPAPFEDELATAAEPVASRRADPFFRSTPQPKKLDKSPGASAAITTPHMPAAATVPNGKPAIADEDIDGDGELDIGEVSRVVNLADLARSVPRANDRAQPAAMRRSGPIPGAADRLSNSNPALRGTQSHPRLSPADLGMAVPAESVDPGQTLAPQVVARSHRRGMIMLLSVAGVLLLGVAGAVILLLSTDDDPMTSGLGPSYHFDPTRPEDPITHRPIEPTNPITPPRPNTPHPWHPGNSSGTNTHQNPDEPLPGNTIRADEIEDVARKYQGTTQRCYMRAQRGANAILIGEVKKISVTLVIDKDGSVASLQLSDHAADDLGKCLTSSIRGWKFRQSPGGTFKFSLNFVDG